MGALVQLVCLLFGVRAGEPLYRPTSLPSVHLTMAAIADEPLAARGPWAPRNDGWAQPASTELDLRRFVPRIRSCYNRALASNPALAGRMKVNARAANGVVTVEILEDTIGDRALAACIGAIFDNLSIARDRSFDVTVPIHFAPAP